MQLYRSGLRQCGTVDAAVLQRFVAGLHCGWDMGTFPERGGMNMAFCDVCFRHCEIPEGGTGFCGARTCEGGEVKAGNYGEITSLALDPVEKKPLARFFPGHLVLSVGSYGCNLRCPFCQNYSISQAGPGGRFAVRTEKISPEELAETAAAYRDRGNIGIA